MSKYHISLGDGTHEVVVGRDQGAVEVDGATWSPDILSSGEDTYSMIIGGKTVTIIAAGGPRDFEFLVNRKTCQVRVISDREKSLRALSSTKGDNARQQEVYSPMPAMVAKILVSPGDTVKVGQGLILIEAMKMENEIRSHRNGKVRDVCVVERQTVDKGQLLLRLE